MTTTGVDAEEIESTRSERALAVVLTVFLLIGALWTYARLDDLARHRIAPVSYTQAERAAVDRGRLTAARAYAAETAVQRTRQTLELQREAYRTALEAHQPAAALARQYRAAQAAFARAQARLAQARAANAAAQPAAAAADRAYFDRAEHGDRSAQWIAALLRLGFAVALLAFGYWLLGRLRRRGARSLPLAFAVLATAAIVALVFACDYVTDWVDPLELGPIVLSLVGVAATLAAFAALQRYLAKRVPARRVRKGECPFCGYPARAGATHCEGCGRELVAACATCHGPRRVGTAHCATCGAP